MKGGELRQRDAMYFPKVYLKLEFICPDFPDVLTSSQASYKVKNKQKNTATQESVYPRVRQIDINKLTLLVHGNTAP